MKFLQLKPDERMIGIYRPYGLTYAGAVIVSFILWILPFFLLGPLFQRGKWGLLGFALLVALALWYSLGKAIHWYYNVCIITDRRIIDIDQRGFIDRTVSEVAYPKIQDVSYRIRGLAATLLRVGTIIIQTAGASTNIEFHKMKNPERLVDLINEFRERTPTEQPKDERLARLLPLLGELSPEELRLLFEEAQRKVRHTAAEQFLKKG